MWQLLRQRARRMERHQVLLVILLVTVPVLAFVLASWTHSRNTTSQRHREASPARSSSMARKPLVGESSGAGGVGDGAPASQEALGAAKEAYEEVIEETSKGPETSPEAEPVPAPPRTEGQIAIDEATNTVDPRVGVTRLERFLSTLKNLQEASNAYAALGALYARLGPAEEQKADSAFALALNLAQTPEEVHYATCLLVRALMARNEMSRALEESGRALSKGGELTLSGLELRMLRGQALEAAARDAEADEAYQKVREDSLAAATVLGPPAMAIYRQSCFALTRLYRRLGRDTDAETVTRLMKTRLELQEQR